jgi:hypothetical protein
MMQIKMPVFIGDCLQSELLCFPRSARLDEKNARARIGAVESQPLDETGHHNSALISRRGKRRGSLAFAVGP